jgi:hypothetical protein
MKEIRSTSFDTSFLLKDKPEVNRVIKELKRDNIDCFITSTVLSELELLKLWGRIDDRLFKLAMSRWKRVNSKIINYKNRLLADEFKRKCVDSMGEYHGVNPDDIINDCRIIITSLKNGMDLFLSEDFHFTSRVTLDVLDEVTNNACVEYYQMCGEEMYCIDTNTFLKAYHKGNVDPKIIESRRKNIKKPGKLL